MSASVSAERVEAARRVWLTTVSAWCAHRDACIVCQDCQDCQDCAEGIRLLTAEDAAFEALERARDGAL